MKLVHPDIGDVISFGEDGGVRQLIIEHPALYQELAYECYLQTKGEVGRFVVSKDDHPLHFSKSVECITSFVPFEPRQKILDGKLLSRLEQEAITEQYYAKTMELCAQVESFYGYLAEALPYEIEFAPPSLKNILKCAGFSPVFTNRDLCEDIVTYMTWVQELEGEKLFVFVGLHSFLSQEQYQLFIETVAKKKFFVLCIEVQFGEDIDACPHQVVDSDFCYF